MKFVSTWLGEVSEVNRSTHPIKGLKKLKIPLKISKNNLKSENSPNLKKTKKIIKILKSLTIPVFT